MTEEKKLSELDLLRESKQSSIDSFRFWDRDDNRFTADRRIDQEVAGCACGNTYFKEVEVFQVMAAHTVVVGQKVVKKDSFYLYECLSCKRLMEPNLLENQQNYMTKIYKKFKETMEGPKS